MPKIVRADKDNLNAVVSITLEPTDYQPQFEEELQKYRKQASLKGFRKGKTPASVIRKMYGKGVLVEVINNLLGRELYSYIDQEKLDILGQPLPAEDQQPLDFDPKNLDAYEFKFDLGLAPAFEIEGLSSDTVFERYEVSMPDDIVDEDLQRIRERHGERVLVTEDIQEQDMLKFDVKELDGDSVKEGGITADFGIGAREITNEPAQKEVLSKKSGDTFHLNLFELFKNRDDHRVRHHLLNIDHDNDDQEVGEKFEVTITEVKRPMPAEMNQEFFDKAFGADKVHDEAEARDWIRADYKDFYDKQADALLFRDFQETLMEKNQMTFPDDFLKRWLEASNEGVSAADIERDYPAFTKNLQWTLLKNRLAKRFEIQITEEEVKDAFRRRVADYFGGYGNLDMINMTVDRLMQDEKQINEISEDILVEKLHTVIAEEVTIKPKTISRDEFMEILTAARAAAQATQTALANGSGDEEE